MSIVMDCLTDIATAIETEYPTATVTAALLPRKMLTDMDDTLYIDVIPNTLVQQGMTRNDVRYDFTASIVFLKKLTNEQTEGEELLGIVENVAAKFVGYNLESIPSSSITPSGISYSPLYDRAELDSNRIWASVINVRIIAVVPRSEVFGSGS